MQTLTQIANLRAASKGKKKLSNQALQDCLKEVVAGSGYVRSDGSNHTCGDSNQSGLQCCLYRAKLKRCVILGPDLEITPTMTCIHDITGPEINTLPAVLSQPADVGLVETKNGANCQRCDRLDETVKDQPACYWLTDQLQSLLDKKGYENHGVRFAVEGGACCSFWTNTKFQKLIT